MSPSAQADTPQVPFQKLSQNSGSHLSQLSAPLFTEDRYSTSTDNDQDNCDTEVSMITRYLIDEFTGQFYAVFGNSYQCMCTIPRLLHTCEPGQLIDKLAATRCMFGCMGPTRPAPATQASQQCPADPVSTAYNEDIIPDLTTQKPLPRTVPYQPPSFNLDRPTRCLMKEERIEVHHNYISAVSSLEHKKDLINRLMRSEPHNIPTYEAEMAHHMALHNDVLGRIDTILKQDDYFRTLEELPVINGLHAYNDIQLFPELFDTSAVIERITSKASLIEEQLNRRSMYPLSQTPFPCTSGFIPRLSSTFWPIMLAAPSPATGVVAAKPPQAQQNKETSPGSSLQCGQGIPTAPTDPQTPVQLDGSTTYQGTPANNLPAHSQFTTPDVTPQTSPIEQQSPIRMQTSQLSQNSIKAPEATVPDSPEERIPKSLNGEGVKNSRKQATTSTTNAQDSRLCFRCKQPGHFKKDCPELPYCSKCRTQGNIPAKCPTKQQDSGWLDKRCEKANKRHETCREDWKKAQDRRHFSNRTNKCLNCAGDHRTHDCPTRQQPHAPPIGNSADGTGIYKNNSQFQNHSPHQHSQQSTSTMGISIPTLMVNNQLQTGP